MADLSITQIMQEEVVETERGAVNGVQDGLQSLFDLTKDTLVIILPDSPTFGLLIIVSFCAVSAGFVSFSVYSNRIRGHLLPFRKKIIQAVS